MLNKKSKEITLAENVPFSFMEAIDSYEDLKISPAARKRLERTVLNVRAGLVSITPLICKGPEECPFKSRCPIYFEEKEGGSYPLDRQCLVEASIVRDRFLEYIEEFQLGGSEIEIGPTLRSLISKLVELDIYDMRLSQILAGAAGKSDGSLLKEQIIAINQEGDEITQLQEHPAWAMKERVYRQRMQLLDELVATPRRKTWKAAALKESRDNDYLSQTRKVQDRLAELISKIEKKD